MNVKKLFSLLIGLTALSCSSEFNNEIAFQDLRKKYPQLEIINASSEPCIGTFGDCFYVYIRFKRNGLAQEVDTILQYTRDGNPNNPLRINEISGYKSVDHNGQKIWLDFKRALETQKVAYLLENSFDYILCVDCVPNEQKTNNEYYKSEFIFKGYLTELIHHNTLEKLNPIFSANDTIIRIVYDVKTETAPEGHYNVVYTFLKSENEFLFEGMFTVP